MTTSAPQPEGAPIELSEETRLQRCELILQLVAVIVAILAAVTEALLESEDASLAEKAGLRLMQAGLAPVVRRLEALAAAYREGLPETDEQAFDAADGPALDGASGRLLAPPPPPLPSPPSPPAGRPAAAASRAAIPIPWPRLLVRPRAGPARTPVLAEEAALHDATSHAHFVAISQLKAMVGAASPSPAAAARRDSRPRS